VLADGSTRKIRGNRLTGMLGESLQGTMREDTRAVLEAASDDCESNGGGHLMEFIRVMAAARVTAAENELQEESYMFSEDEMNPARADSTLPNPNPAQQPETDLPSGWPLPKITPVPLEDRGWHPTTGKFGGERQ
jgi:hypothetical protein